MSDTPQDLIPPTRAARLLGCCVTTAYRWVWAGTLRAWRVGDRYRLSEAGVRATIAPVKPFAPPPTPAERRAAEDSLRRGGAKK